MIQPIINNMNNTIIDSKIDYINEAYSLLVRLGCGARYAATHKELKQKYPNSLKNAPHKFAILEAIENDTLKLLAKEKAYQETLDYYFKANPDNSECIAELALLYVDFDSFCPNSLNELSNHLFQMERKEFERDFGVILQGYNSIVKDTTEYVNLTDSMDIIRHTMSLDLPNSEKWKIIEIFTDPKPHQEKLLALLDATIQIFQNHKTELEDLVAEFTAYWSNKLIETSPSSIMKDSLGIVISECDLGTVIHPLIIHMNQLRAHADDEEECYDEYKIGILFDDDFLLKTAGENSSDNYQDYALRNLKTLSDKSKFDILCYIKNKKAYGSELAKQLDLTTATISHHMSALLSAGLVKMEKENNRIYYSSNQENIEKLLNYCKEKLI